MSMRRSAQAMASPRPTEAPHVSAGRKANSRVIPRSHGLHQPVGRGSLDLALAPVQRELEAVTTRMLSQLQHPIAGMVAYLITAGGKRLRPALVLLSGASAGSPDWPALTDAATAVELIHTATLIHDDIIDQSPRRRSQPTFHYRWGTERAVLMGDYLYATAFTVLARLNAPQVVETMADVCQQLSRGELREVEARYRLDLSEQEYLEIIREKTASLIGGCCRCGALLGGAAPRAAERLAEFGINFGLAFQIVDDCLDLMGDAAQLGKSIHADLDKGALSLPIIYLTQILPARQRRRLFGLLGRSGARALDPRSIARIAKAAAECGTIERAYARARELIDAAMRMVREVPMNGLATSYQQLAEYAVSRSS